MARLINPTPQYFDGSGLVVSDGKLFFFVAGTNAPLDTFADSELSIPNTNPVLLDGAGRCPNIFFSGNARLILEDSLGTQIFERDPVGADNITGNFAPWDNFIIYDVNDTVEGSDGRFYISLVSGNQGNDPITPSPTFWSQIRIITVYNAFDVYAEGDVVQETDGNLWKSLVDLNIGNTPSTDSGANWLPAVDGDKLPAQINSLTVIPQLGGGTLTALRINELQDGSTYDLPAASSILVNQTITIDLPSTFAAFAPVVNADGADTITDEAGSDTSITFIGPTQISLTSDGVSEWRL